MLRVSTRAYKDAAMPFFLEALKYLKTSKQHPFETPGSLVLLSFVLLKSLQKAALKDTFGNLETLGAELFF